MQTYELTLESEATKTFMCTKAADSLDIDVEAKLKHNFKVSADISSPFSVALIVGASGSGKTTFAKHVYGENCFKSFLDKSRPVIDQFPKDFSYDDRAKALSGVGLTSVPCWIRPAATLSNGQQARAEIALAVAKSNEETIIIDEWTSVVDRTIAKIMSNSVQKYVRKNNKKIVLLSCHYDVKEWLMPDWIIDCNKQEYQEHRRSLWQRSEKLEFEVKECDSKSWKYFSKYHYLSSRLACGKIYCFGLFHKGEQVGFQCFANYVPVRKATKNNKKIFHSNRVVVHPDYIGFGLGLKMTDAACEFMKKTYNYKIYAKFSSVPMRKGREKNKKWRLKKVSRDLKTTKGLSSEKSQRIKVKTYSYEFIGNK